MFLAWTACPYVQKDSRHNPDTDLLPARNEFHSMSEAVLLNAIAFVLTNAPPHAFSAVNKIDTFFNHPALGMNPNVNFGQIIRGSSPRMGSYMGILDLRSIVKVVNAVQILRLSKAPAWDYTKDQRLVHWAQLYIAWLRTNNLALEAEKQPKYVYSYKYSRCVD